MLSAMQQRNRHAHTRTHIHTRTHGGVAEFSKMNLSRGGGCCYLVKYLFRGVIWKNIHLGGEVVSTCMYQVVQFEIRLKIWVRELSRIVTNLKSAVRIRSKFVERLNVRQTLQHAFAVKVTYSIIYV